MEYLLDTNIMIAYLREPNSTQEYVDRNFAPLDIALVLDAILLTNDSDFDYLQNEFLQVARIDLVN